MDEQLKFLEYFPKDNSDMYIVFDYYTFDNLYKLLLKNAFDYEDALTFIIANCSLSGNIFQDRIFSEYYLILKAEDVLSPEEAAIKANFINDMLTIIIEK